MYGVLLRSGPYERRLGTIILIVGPAIEIACIQIGHLLRYYLGWLGGVPVWIAVWWVLGLWVWSDLAPRLQWRLIGAAHGGE